MKGGCIEGGGSGVGAKDGVAKERCVHMETYKEEK